MSLDTSDGSGLAVVQLVDGTRPPATTSRLQSLLTAGDLVVNLRAEADPPLLAGILIDALGREIDALGIDVVHERVDYFKPARPEPTHRITKRLEIGD